MAERRGLPIIPEQRVAEPPETTHGTKESRLTPEMHIQKFFKEKYPLSEQGLALRKEIEAVQATHDTARLAELASQLPTVENPRLELFKDLEIAPEQEQEIFGWQLANVQITKGCRHRCTFCAANAGARVETMPFVAVLKIAEKMRRQEQRVQELWHSWESIIDEEFKNTDIESQLREKASADPWGIVDLDSRIVDAHMRRLTDRFPAHPLKDAINWNKEQRIFAPRRKSDIAEPLNNYYDSDPFDYRDTAFPHMDGTPADLADVVAVLGSELRPIYISTAGWPKRDQVAQRAAEKIVRAHEKDPSKFSTIRISVNKYDVQARRSFDDYRAQMENVIATLKNVDPWILCYYRPDNPEDKEFMDKVIMPLQALWSRLGKGKMGEIPQQVSQFSGPMADESFRDDVDVMACLPGFHVWPDGTVARQAGASWVQLSEGHSRWQPPKGSRPQPSRLKLY